MLRASSHRGGLMCPRRDSEPRVEKRTRSIVPEFWVLATNPETILLGQCLWTFFLHVRDVLWGKRRVGRKECIITSFFFFCNFLALLEFTSHTYKRLLKHLPCRRQLPAESHREQILPCRAPARCKSKCRWTKQPDGEISRPLPILPPA